MTYYLIIGVVFIISMIVQNRLRSKFAHYSKVHLQNGMSGKEIAEKMLRDSNIHDVQVISVPGQLTDHYNPMNKTINLSEGVYMQRNAAAAAVAAHETGHAVQHAVGYSMLQLRSKMVPMVNISSRLLQFVLMAGIGVDAAAVADVRPAEKRLLGKGAYVLAGLRRCLDWDNRLITVHCAGQTCRCTSLIVANAAHYAGSYRLVPQATLFAPHLIITPLPINGPFSLLTFTASVFLRGKYEAAEAFSSGLEPFTITGTKPVQLDGDSFGTTPLTIRVLPDFNNLII